jgi:hypothetical protein
MAGRFTASGGIEGAARQAIAIGRATLAGFLQSDLMPQGMQAPALIWAAAFFVGPAILLPLQFMQKYSFMRKYVPAEVPGALVNDRLLFLTLSCSAIGLIAVVLWETLFPSRRDAFVLGPLPVSRGVQTTGRLLGLAALFITFFVGLNILPSALFALVAAPSLSVMPRWAAAHAAASLSADAFVFFGITTLQGLTLLAAGPRRAARLAALLQAVSVLTVLSALLLLGGMQQLLRGAFLQPESQPLVLRWFPPSWFTALFAWLADGSGPGPSIALRAVVAAVLPVGATVSIYAFGYKRLSARALETRERSSRSPIARAAGAAIKRVLVRREEEQALSGFMLRVLARSDRHRMLVSAAAGVAAAIAIAGVLPEWLRSGRAAYVHPSQMVLAVPLVLSAALGVSLRLVMTIPVDLPARWVLTAIPLSRRRVDAATHKTMLLAVLPPVVFTALLTAWPLWGRAIAIAHAVFCLSLAWVLCELLLVGFHGIPFTRQYVPGGARIHTLWPVYIAAFTLYTYGFASLEQLLLPGSGALVAAVVFGSIAFSIAGARHISRRGDDDVDFESGGADEAFRGFNLTEAYAAERVATAMPSGPETHVAGRVLAQGVDTRRVDRG